MKRPRLGATGEYPHGKINPDDEGALNVGVAADGMGNVHVDFGKPVSWFTMPSEQAINFAKLILTHAGAKNIEIEL